MKVAIWRKFTQDARCEVCKGPTRQAQSLKHASTYVRFCSKECRRKRHNKRAA